MIKSRLTLTLLGACAVLAAAWPFRYQLYLHLPSEPVQRLVVLIVSANRLTNGFK